MGENRWVAPGRDTFPKLLALNAKRFADRPASREKMYGIWQAWTWAQVQDETRAMALGLMELGLAPGERMAIVGTNRPPLYWSMVAAQMVGAMPVPIYQDSVAEEMVFVLQHAEVTFVIAEDQEQVDKVLSLKDRLPSLRHVVYRDPRGLRNYDHAALHALADVQRLGRENAGSSMAPSSTGASQRRGADGRLRRPLHLGHDGQPQGRRADQRQRHLRRRLVLRVRQAEREGRDRWPICRWPGSATSSSPIGQSYWSGFCVSCPESPDTMLADLKEIGPTYFFAPPRIYENLLTTVMIRMEDAPGWMRRLFHRYIGFARRVGGDILDGKPVGLGTPAELLRSATCWSTARCSNTLGMSRIRLAYTAGEAIGPEIFRFYRSIGINLKQLYGQTEASVFITAAAGRPGARRHGRRALARGRDPHRR